MAQETGHAKNVANFAQVISIADSLGAKYNPSNALIETAALRDLKTSAEAALADVAEKEAAEDIAVNERQDAFDRLTKLVPRISNAASASVNDAAFDENIKSITRKLLGRRAAPKPDAAKLAADGETPKKTISASQMSFDNRIRNFAELIALLKTEPRYTPNESELQTAALDTFQSNLQTKNTNAQTASIAAANARAARNRLLYDPEGIIPRVVLIKNYLKSLGNEAEPQYKQAVAMKFKKPGS